MGKLAALLIPVCESARYRVAAALLRSPRRPVVSWLWLRVYLLLLDTEAWARGRVLLSTVKGGRGV